VFYTSGIYAIINQANGKVYMGQSVKTYSRLNGQKRQLRNNTHCNKQLQSEYQANPKQFIFKVLFQCPPDELNYYEALMIQEAMKQGFEVYNIIKNPFKDLAIQIEERKQGYEEFTGSTYEDVKVKMVKHWLSC